MAGSGRRTFAPGEVLTASNVMNYLQDQAVMNFAGTAARGSAIGTAVAEGMVSYLQDTNDVQVYDGSAWSSIISPVGTIVNVASTTKTDTFSRASTSPVDITGFSVSITPKKSANKIMITVSHTVANSSGSPYAMQITRNGTVVGGGTTAGSRVSASASTYIEAGGVRSVSFSFVDSPNSTSSLTYQVKGFTTSGTFYIGRSSADADGTTPGSVRTASTITAVEIVG